MPSTSFFCSRILVSIVMLAKCSACCASSTRRRRFGTSAFVTHAPSTSLPWSKSIDITSRTSRCISPVAKWRHPQFRRPIMGPSLFNHRQFTCFGVHKSSNNEIQDYDSPDKSMDGKGGVSYVLNTIRQSLCGEIIPTLLESKTHLGLPRRESPMVLLLAVSGGCDSVALLHAMHQLWGDSRKSDGEEESSIYFITNEDDGNEDVGIGEEALSMNVIPCEIHVVHFDHQQRGEESDGDHTFVRDLCSEAGFIFHSFWWEEQDEATSQTFSQEMARDWRRRKLIELLNIETCNGQKHGVVLTAHHRDDCDETIILKLLRGAHISNMSGMDVIDQGRHGNSNSVPKFAKPMLQLSKEDIEDFLNGQGFDWREDSSNASDKYLRNRVRNEILPVLSDVVGSRDLLHKRLKILEEQSRKVKKDLSSRAADYLTENVIDNKGAAGTLFRIPTTDEFDIVHEQSLYTWLDTESKGQLQLSYEQLKRIFHQLSSYPTRRKWSLDIGNRWTVKRNGDILSLARGGSETRTRSDEWILVPVGGNVTANTVKGGSLEQDVIRLAIPESKIGSKLAIKYVEGNERCTFIPPWRKGRNPIKIKDFLRGQKVPMHERASTPILCFEDDHDSTVIAAFVDTEPSEGRGKWLIHSSFQDLDDSEGDSDPITSTGTSLQIRLVRVR